VAASVAPAFARFGGPASDYLVFGEGSSPREKLILADAANDRWAVLATTVVEGADPVLTPDGRWFEYTDWTATGQFDSLEHSTTTSVTRSLPHSHLNDQSHVFASPAAGGFVIASALRGPDDALVRIDPNGHRTILVATPGVNELDPALSPDGKCVAFIHEDGRKRLPHDLAWRDTVYVIRSNGTDEHAVSDGSLIDDAEDPTWMPGGTRIAYDVTNQLHYSRPSEIWSVALDGRDTHREFPGFQPDWSADGTRVAFVRSIAGHNTVFVANADGSDPHVVVASSSDQIEPRWAPIPTGAAGAAGAAGGPEPIAPADVPTTPALIDWRTCGTMVACDHALPAATRPAA
jgi:Tol biopolymer transport system component